MTLEEIVEIIRNRHFTNPPARPDQVEEARSRGIAEPLLDLFRLADGAYVGDGDDFRAPGEKRFRFRFRIPRLAELKSAADFGYGSEESPMRERLKSWWPFLDYGDGNFLGMTDAADGFRIVDLFHETVGEPGSHAVIAPTLEHLLSELLRYGEVYWLDDRCAGKDRI
jgi:hypothetical protein